MQQALSSFDPAKHEYLHNGIKVPNVTGVLLAEGLYKGSEYFTEAGRIFGTYVHQACEFYDLGTLDFETLDPPLAGCVASYALFKEQTGFVPELIEHHLTSVLGLGGTPDRYGEFTNIRMAGGDTPYGKKAVIDFKSGTPQPADKIQTCLYQLLLEQNGKRVDVRGTLYLRRDGKMPRWVPHRDRSHFAVAGSVLTTYNFKREEGLI